MRTEAPTDKVIRPFVDAQDFLCQLCKIRGRLRHGGLPDLENCAKVVLQDWCTGKIPYHTPVPVAASHELAMHVTADKETQIVAQWAAEFNIDKFQSGGACVDAD